VQVWNVTSTTERFRFIPLITQHQRRQPDRLAFVQVFLWAMPERAKQVGTMLALGLDPATFQRVSEELPDIIPRGMTGWRHFG
jgi:hypothetical protein